jgi:hypothetical protein
MVAALWRAMATASSMALRIEPGSAIPRPAIPYAVP